MNWSRQRVLVTGAAGFIGSHLTERLVEAGARTRGLIRYSSAGTLGWLEHSPLRASIDIMRGDIRDAEIVHRACRDIDIVFHLAALVGIPYSYEAPQSYLKTNVEGTLNILQAALSNNVGRVVHTSTSEVYGTAQSVPISEDHPLHGQSPYSASKIAADKFVESVHLSFSLPVSTVRPFNTFGPRQSARAVIPTIIMQALAGRAVHLGNLAPTRDFSYIADTVYGFMCVAASERTVGRVVNIGTGREISIERLARLIFQLVGREVQVVEEPCRVRRPGSEVERLLADNRLAMELTGWHPQVSLEDGLMRTIEWIRPNLESFHLKAYAV